MDAVVKKCGNNCKHDYQDQKYGPGMRVHNQGKDGKLNCTVCGGTNVKK